MARISTLPDDLPERLERFKEESGLTWIEIARRLGLQVYTMRRWRRGLSWPTTKAGQALLNLARDLDCGHLFEEDSASMTVEDAGLRLTEAYKGSRGPKSMAVVLFGIEYAAEIRNLSSTEIVQCASIPPRYDKQLNDGRNLARYVTMRDRGADCLEGRSSTEPPSRTPCSTSTDGPSAAPTSRPQSGPAKQSGFAKPDGRSSRTTTSG